MLLCKQQFIWSDYLLLNYPFLKKLLNGPLYQYTSEKLMEKVSRWGHGLALVYWQKRASHWCWLPDLTVMVKTPRHIQNLSKICLECKYMGTAELVIVHKQTNTTCCSVSLQNSILPAGCETDWSPEGSRRQPLPSQFTVVSRQTQNVLKRCYLYNIPWDPGKQT